MATLFVDYENGNDNNAGTSFDVLASGTNGRISSLTFSSSTASFPNNGTLCSINNILGASERLFDTSAWTSSNITTTRLDLTPPSGIVGNVHSLIENTANTTHSIFSVSNTYLLTVGSTYTVSVYAKANGRNEIVIRFDTAATRGIRYNLSSGTIVQSGASATGTITNIGDGWYRLTLTATAPATGSAVVIALTNDAYNDTTTQSYTGDGTSGIYVAGLQLETGNTATTYEKSPTQYLSIFTGSAYSVYEIVQYLSSTSLLIKQISGGTGAGNQTVDRQYYIGGRWKTLTSGATSARLMEGDTVRIMGSPAPTSIGSATWTGQKTQNAIAITSSTNTSPITINCASTMSSLGITTGDTITIVGHTTNTNANGTWEVTVSSPSATSFTLNGSTGNGVGGGTGRFRKKTNSVIRLPSALTANIASYGNRGEGRTAWTAATNVTTAFVDTDNGGGTREGDVSDSIAIGATFTTGKAAYKATGTLDLSGYQQISFFIKQTAGTASVNGDISLRLCSDTTGDVPVHTFNIEGVGLISSVFNVWTTMTIDLGSNMNSNIQSIALYVDTDRGAQTFLLSNIIACKAISSNDSLNLCSLIGKNTTDEAWYPIMSINGTRVMLSSGSPITSLSGYGITGSSAGTDRGYYGISESVTTYKRETIKTALSTGVTTSISTLNQAGTASNIVRYLFGWDRTNMSTQNLETYLDGRSGAGTGVQFGVTNVGAYIYINKLGVVRYNTGCSLTGGGSSGMMYLTLDAEWAVGCTAIGWNIGSTRQSIFNNLRSSSCGSTSGGYTGITISSSGSNIFNNIIITNCTANPGSISMTLSYNNKIYNMKIFNTDGIGFRSSDGSFDTIIDGGAIEACATIGIDMINSNINTVIKNLTISNNTSSGIRLGGGDLIVKNCLIDQSLETDFVERNNAKIHLINNDNVAGNNFTTTDFGLIVPQTSVRYSNSGFAWAMSPTSVFRDILYPLRLKVATVAVEANSLVTVRAWVRRSSTALTMGLRLEGDQVAGVPSDITSYMTAAADTWEQISLTFTPTEVGVVDILAECYGGTTHTGYIDDISIIQG